MFNKIKINEYTKKILGVFLVMLIFGVGCTNKSKSENPVNQKDLVGYYLQVESNFNGDITDLTNNQYAYLEITKDRLFFYTISDNENEGYGVSEKYYKLNDGKIYYDYDELKDRSLKDISESVYGGIFYPSIDNKKLVLTEYSNDKDKLDGYSIDTYEKILAKDWPIEE